MGHDRRQLALSPTYSPSAKHTLCFTTDANSYTNTSGSDTVKRQAYITCIENDITTTYSATADQTEARTLFLDWEKTQTTSYYFQNNTSSSGQIATLDFNAEDVHI